MWLVVSVAVGRPFPFHSFKFIFQLKHLTGSTADTYLEYIQRNLPEGVAMKVTKVKE